MPTGRAGRTSNVKPTSKTTYSHEVQPAVNPEHAAGRQPCTAAGPPKLALNSEFSASASIKPYGKYPEILAQDRKSMDDIRDGTGFVDNNSYLNDLTTAAVH